MSQNTKNGVNILLVDTREEESKEAEGNFELVIEWNEENETLILKRVIPDEDGNSHFKYLRGLKNWPTIDIVLNYLCKVREEFPQTEVHLEYQMASIYFPFKEE